MFHLTSSATIVGRVLAGVSFSQVVFRFWLLRDFSPRSVWAVTAVLFLSIVVAQIGSWREEKAARRYALNLFKSSRCIVQQDGRWVQVSPEEYGARMASPQPGEE